MATQDRITRLEHAPALLGGIGWGGLLIASWAGTAPLGIIEQLFLFAPLVIVPVGLTLLGRQTRPRASQILTEAARLAQPIAAALVVVSLLIPRGTVAAALVIGWLLVAGLVGLSGLMDLLKGGFRHAEGWCFAAGRLFLPLGALGLSSSRLGSTPFGFQEPLVLLFAVHYHYTGFAVPLIAGAMGRAVERSTWDQRFLFPAITVGVIGGPPLIAAGFMSYRALIVIGVLFLAATLCLLAGLMYGLSWVTSIRTAQVLLAVSATSLLISMVLACIYSIGEYRGNLLVDIPQMAWIHGSLNAIGFSLCGLIAGGLLEGGR